MDLGRRIKRVRMDRKITQKELADLVDADAGYISRIENNKQTPSVQTLERMAKGLECDISEFFGEKQQIPSELQGKVEWIAFAEEMNKKELTPDEIKKIIEVFNMMKDGKLK